MLSGYLVRGTKMDYLPVVKSKLRSINDMVSNLRVHKEEMEKIRNEHLIHELEEATMKKEGYRAKSNQKLEI